MKRVILFLAEGFEEVEAVTPIDFLRRAGIEVLTAGIGGNIITGAQNIKITADTVLDASLSSENFDGVVVPGGMPGASNIAADADANRIISEMAKAKKLVAAICAAPAVVLNSAGVLSGKTATCYPGFEQKFASDVKFSDSRVVVDGNLITARGAGTAAEFAFEIISILVDRETAEKIHNGTIQK